MSGQDAVALHSSLHVVSVRILWTVRWGPCDQHVDGKHGRFLIERGWWPRLDMGL